MEVINGSTERHSDKNINRTQTPLAVSCMWGQPRPWGTRGPSTTTAEVAEPSLSNVPKKSRRVPCTVLTCTTLEHGCTIKRSHLQLTNSRLGGCCFPMSRQHAQNEGKSPVQPPLSCQISPAARPDLDLCHSTPLTQTPSKGWQLRALIALATRATNLPMVQNHLFNWNRKSWDFLSPGRAKVFSFTLVTTLSLLRRENYLHSPQEWKCKQ